MIDVTKHGVVPDGRDCSEAFQELVEGTLFFPPGTYVFSESVMIPGNVRMLGSGVVPAIVMERRGPEANREVVVDIDEVSRGPNLLDLLQRSGMAEDRNAARRVLQQGGVFLRVGKTKLCQIVVK